MQMSTFSRLVAGAASVDSSEAEFDSHLIFELPNGVSVELMIILSVLTQQKKLQFNEVGMCCLNGRILMCFF